MNRLYRAGLLVAAIAAGPISGLISPPASAQSGFAVGFDAFHDRLASYGDWVYSDRWGEVWIPQDVPADFHPYQTNGYWAYTGDYGWTWASNYEWGDIPFHYGRWVNDPDDGWLWIPGYVWSPGWVIWRSNSQYTGWMPMPPDDAFLNEGGTAGVSIGLGGSKFSIDFGDTSSYYGYARWYGAGYDEGRFASNWAFVETKHVADHDYRPYMVNRTNVANIIHNTTNITNYTVVNNYYVNKSVDPRQVEKASGHPVQAVQARTLMKNPSLIARIDTGQQIQMRARRENPRGNGLANSAPKPPPAIVKTLSARPLTRNGRASAHLFTQQTVAKAPLPAGPSATNMPARAQRDKAPNAVGAPRPPMPGPTAISGPVEPGPSAIPSTRMRERPTEGPKAQSNPVNGSAMAAPGDRPAKSESSRGERPNPNVRIAPVNEPPERHAAAAKPVAKPGANSETPNAHNVRPQRAPKDDAERKQRPEENRQ